MNEEHDLPILAEIFKDDTTLTFHISIRDLWFLDSVLALSWRHPDLSLHQKNWMEHLHWQLIPPILEAHPEAKDLLNAGWDTSQDRPLDKKRTEAINQQYRDMEKKYLRKTGRK